MRLEDVRRIVREPRLLTHMIRAWAYELRHPHDPWWDPGAVAYLQAHLAPGARALEWGSGRSTLWLAQRIAHITTVEHHPTWVTKVRHMLERAHATNVELVFIELPQAREELDALYWEATPYEMVAERFEDGSLDLVVVDGLFRQPCAWRALQKVAPGGLILIDDAAHLPALSDWRIPEEWSLEYRPAAGSVWSTTIWRRPA